MYSCIKLGNRDFVSKSVSKLAGKKEDSTLLVILLINYQLKSLVCFVLSRFCNLKFTSKYNSLNKQNLSSLKITPYIFL